jgi:hypothetical protein
MSKHLSNNNFQVSAEAATNEQNPFDLSETYGMQGGYRTEPGDVLNVGVEQTLESTSPRRLRSTEYHRTISRRLLGALGAGALLLGAGSYEGVAHLSAESGIETSATAIDHYVMAEPSEVSVGVRDPKLRSTAVSLLLDGFKLGSASLLRMPDGTVDLVTVEHVARPYAHMPEVVHQPDASGGPTVEIKPPLTGDNRALIPGFGLVSQSSAPKFFTSSGKLSKGSDADLFAEIPLSAPQQAALKGAEQKGVLAIPERSQLHPKLGDTYYMVSAEEGEKMPLVYLNGAAGTYNFVPLVILDTGLSSKQGKQNLLSAIQTQRSDFLAQQKSDPELVNPGESYFLQNAVSQLATTFENKYSYMNVKHSKSTAEKLSTELPCMGDSGSPVLDGSGNTFGVLSSGEGFNNTYSFMRDNQGNMYCLSSVVVDGIPQNIR